MDAQYRHGGDITPEVEEVLHLQKIFMKCEKVNNLVYQFPFSGKVYDTANRLAKYEVGEWVGPEGGVGKVLMLVGATGAGKMP